MIELRIIDDYIFNKLLFFIYYFINEYFLYDIWVNTQMYERINVLF